MSKTASRSPFLYEDVTNRIVGACAPNRTPLYFAQTFTPGVSTASRTSTNTAADTDITPLLDLLIPARSMGRNGFIELDLTFTATNSAVLKRGFLFLGTQQIYNVSVSSTFTARLMPYIHNQNAFNAQASGPNVSVNPYGVGTFTGTVVSSSVDTSVDQILSFRCSFDAAVAGETISLRRYSAKIVYVD